MPRRLTFVLRTLSHRTPTVSLALALLTIPVSAGPVVNVLTGSQFGEMDLATGAFSPIGPIPANIQYLAPGPNGSLLTMSFNGDLDSINRITGMTSVIGPTGFSDCSTPSTSSCGPDSQLSLSAAGGIIYATDFANNLYTINSATGKATLIGATGIPAVPFIPASINPDGSLNLYDEIYSAWTENSTPTSTLGGLIPLVPSSRSRSLPRCMRSMPAQDMPQKSHPQTWD